MNDGAQARLLLMYRSQAQAEVKYGAAFFLILKGIFKNRSFPQVRHDRTRAVSTSRKDNATRQSMAHQNTRTANLRTLTRVLTTAQFSTGTL